MITIDSLSPLERHTLNNPPYSISDIRATLAYVMEDGYNDRFTFTDNGSVLEVYDEHLFKRVLTCEYEDGHYIMRPYPDRGTGDQLVLKDGPDDPSPWVQLNTWLDKYDAEYPVSDKQYIIYLEKRIEKLERQLNDLNCKLVATEIERDILKDKQTMKDTFNPIMKNCRVAFYGGLFLRTNNRIRAYNEITFEFTLPYILSQLGTHHITSVKPNEYVYYKFTFGNNEYDLRDHQQFLKLRDKVINSYNEWVEFYKNKGK